MSLTVPIKDGDWNSVRFAVGVLSGYALGVDSTPTFAGLTLSGLTATRLVQTDANKVLASVSNLTSWIAGTTNRITVTDDTDGTVTLSAPQDIHTGASPTFVGLTLSGLTQGSVLFAGVGGLISQDNSNLFWDDTNNRLGIGTATPSACLDIENTALPAGTSRALKINHRKATAGGTLYGIDVDVRHDVSGSSDKVIPLNLAARISDGTFADSQRLLDFYGAISGGSFTSIRGIQNQAVISGSPTLSVDLVGAWNDLTVAATVTVGGDIIGQYLNITNSGATVTGDVYTLKLAGSGVDWGIWDGSGGDWVLDGDNQKLFFGEGQDASIYYDATDLIIDTDVVGSGSCIINGLIIDKDANLTTTGGVTAGASTFGDGGVTNYAQFAADGDLTFVGTAGLPFGNCYGNHIGWSQASAVQNTWYNISDADMADGNLNNVTHDGNGKLTVASAGMYFVSYSCCFEDNVANDHVEIGIEVTGSGSANAAGQVHLENKFASEEEHSSSSAILDLAASATLEIAIRTTDVGTPTISVQAVNLTCIQIGGT